MAHHDLGYLNDALYGIANNPSKYAADFFDVNLNSNGAYSASQRWDAVTGLDTPNAAKLLPDLIAALP